MPYFLFILLHVCDATTHERQKTNKQHLLAREKSFPKIQLGLRACKDKVAEIPQDFFDNTIFILSRDKWQIKPFIKKKVYKYIFKRLTITFALYKINIYRFKIKDDPVSIN